MVGSATYMYDNTTTADILSHRHLSNAIDPHALLMPVRDFKKKYKSMFEMNLVDLGQKNDGSVVLIDHDDKNVAIRTLKNVNKNHIKAMLQLHHKSILPVYNVAFDNEQTLIAMEAATDYGGLNEILDKISNSKVDAASLKEDLLSLALGLQHIHSNNWSNLQLTPKKILRVNDAKLKIFDFESIQPTLSRDTELSDIRYLQRCFESLALNYLVDKTKNEEDAELQTAVEFYRNANCPLPNLLRRMKSTSVTLNEVLNDVYFKEGENTKCESLRLDTIEKMFPTFTPTQLYQIAESSLERYSFDYYSSLTPSHRRKIAASIYTLGRTTGSGFSGMSFNFKLSATAWWDPNQNEFFNNMGVNSKVFENGWLSTSFDTDGRKITAVVIATPDPYRIKFIQFHIGVGTTVFKYRRKVTLSSQMLNICKANKKFASDTTFVTNAWADFRSHAPYHAIKRTANDFLQINFVKSLMTYRPPSKREIEEIKRKLKSGKGDSDAAKTVYDFVNTVCSAIRFNGWYNRDFKW